jgi:hypothetical protein
MERYQMPVYKLTPALEHVASPSWKASTLRDACWIDAESEELARVLIEGQTLKRIDAKPGEPLNVFSPWKQGEITTCEENDPGFVIEPHVIFLADGKRFTN